MQPTHGMLPEHVSILQQLGGFIDNQYITPSFAYLPCGKAIARLVAFCQYTLVGREWFPAG
jgi:hypothetical protein